MAQAGTLVVCGDSGPNLGDSLYEATIYVRGKIHSLGADAREEEMQPADVENVSRLLAAADVECDAKQFRRVASARALYHWNTEDRQEY
jgi:glutamate synthase domain-containing protein 3